MKKYIAINIICALLILLFTYAATSKLLNWDTFYFEINNQPFPNWLTNYLMVAIILVEFMLSILLIVERTKMAGLIGSLLTMLIFTGYIVMILMNQFPYVPCSCGGFINDLSWQEHLFFNLFFVIVSIVAIALHKSESTSLNSFGRQT